MKKITLLIGILLLFSCKKEVQVLNGNSAQEFDESIETIAKTLPLYQQERLREAVQIIFQFDAPSLQTEIRWSKIRNKLNGKTAEEIFDFADRIAKEKGLNWSSTSSTAVLQFNKKEVSDTDTLSKALDYSALKQVNKLTIQTQYYDQNADQISDGIMVFPSLTDDRNNFIEFSNLPLKTTLVLYSGGAPIHSIYAQFTNSNMGSVSSYRGFFIPFSQVPLDKVQAELIEVEMKLQTPYKNLSSKAINVPFDASEWAIKNDLQTNATQEEKTNIEHKAQETLNQFLQYLGTGNFKQAFALSQNSKWKDYETFSSPVLGFGSITGIETSNVKVLSSTSNSVLINAIYKATDGKGNSKIFNQNFTLDKKEEQWIIVNSKNN